jgi:hypothetical protein
MRAVGQEGIEPRKVLGLARRLQVLARNQGLEKVFRRDTWERCHRRLCQGWGDHHGRTSRLNLRLWAGVIQSKACVWG